MKWCGTLYARLALMLVVLLGAMGVVYALLSVSSTRHYLNEVNQQFNRDLAQRLVADRSLVESGRLNRVQMKAMFEHYMTINPSIEIYLLDDLGSILAYSAEPGKVKRNSVSLAPIRAFLADGKMPLLGDDPRSHDRQKAFSVTRVPLEKGAPGYLYVVLRGEQYDKVNQAAEQSYFLQLSAWAVSATLLFGLLLGLLLFYGLTRRLRRLTALMAGFRKGALEVDDRYGVPTHGRMDEVDLLGRTFDEMANRINEQMLALQCKDHLRRELVAHVSHDLRTPLASLHGYLETLQLKEQSLSAEERREYIHIALRHSERLTRLVMDLFELARLDAEECELHPESFAPAELVQDIVQKYQLQARQRGVELTMKYQEQVPMVTGEIGLIERALENLIENSLQHTPSGGRAQVAVHSEGNQVRFSVSDSGSGIAEVDIPRVFERFFQAGDGHRGGQHAGLGLAIVKRIVELHGKTIDVESRRNLGTCFHFCLPCSGAGALA